MHGQRALLHQEGPNTVLMTFLKDPNGDRLGFLRHLEPLTERLGQDEDARR
jgi:hypothetical protein